MHLGIGDCRAEIAGGLRALVHRLEQEMGEGETFEAPRVERLLRVDELELIARALVERRAAFGAYADPVHRARHRQRAICLDGDFEAFGMKRRGERLIDLQHRLAAGRADRSARSRIAAPRGAGGAGGTGGVGELAADRSVGTDEIGVAEIADGAGTIRLAALPAIAAGEAAEHGRAAGLHAFALERVIDFLYRIHGPNLVS